MKEGISSYSGSEAADKTSWEEVYSTSSVNLSKY